MAVYDDREAYIPYRKADVIELCIEDGKLSEADGQKFREFCEILGAYYHFDFHKNLEMLKNNFVPFDPDSDTKSRVTPTAEEKTQMEHTLVSELSHVLEKANYSKLTEKELEFALNEESLITLKLDVDFDDYASWILYHRGDSQETVEVKKMGGLKKVDFTMDIYERIILLLKFKDEDYFLKKFKGSKKKMAALNFEPGKMYIYMYKNVPKADLEILFPNVEISMNLKDKLMLGVPALGAGIPVLIKMLPNLLLLASIIFAIVAGKQPPGEKVMPAIIAALTALAALGGFVFKQYIKYKNKRIQFLKQVSDTLFFKNLVSNGGVFNSLIDSAEEEECKEVFLAYYHLLTADKGMNQEELDDHIEGWLEDKFDTKIDFDVDKALEKMENLKGKIVNDEQDEDSIPEQALLTRDDNGICSVLEIDDAKTIVDYVWDNIFQYNAVLE